MGFVLAAMSFLFTRLDSSILLITRYSIALILMCTREVLTPRQHLLLILLSKFRGSLHFCIQRDFNNGWPLEPSEAIEINHLVTLN